MSDLINGREMLNRYQVDLCDGIACKDCSMSTEEGGCRVEEWIDKFPSADRPQDDEFKNFDRGDLIALIEAQKERIGELLADRPQGEWIYTDNPLRLDDEWACSRCGNISFAKTNYCDRCGCRMRKENE